MTQLPRVRAGLLQHRIDDQVLVYDSRGDRVHLLDKTTACVLTLLEEGGWTREGIAAEVSARLGVEAEAGYLPLALEELRAADLLAPAPEASSMPDVTRRALMKKMAIAGSAALLIPTIVTYTATAGYAQSATGSVGLCGACTSNSQCQSPLTCGTDGTLKACGSNKTANGGACSGSGNCCSNTCSAAHVCVP